MISSRELEASRGFGPLPGAAAGVKRRAREWIKAFQVSGFPPTEEGMATLAGLRAFAGEALGRRKDRCEESVRTGSSALRRRPEARPAPGTRWTRKARGSSPKVWGSSPSV